MSNKKQHIPSGYKPSPLGPIPEDWEVKRLGEVGSFSKGSGVPKDKIISEGHPCLTYGDLYTKYDFVIKDIKSFIDEETSKESKEINAGDICFAGSGETPEDIGKCAAYLENCPAYAGGDIVILSPNNNINSLWLSYLLNSDIGGKQRYKFAQGFSIVHIYPDNLKQIQIPVPPLPEQQRIVSVLSLWDTAIAKQTALIEMLTLRKRGLMQQLLTGKKRLKGFSGEWKEVRLGEVCSFLSNNTLSREQLNNKNGEVQNIHYGDVLIKHPSILDCNKTVLPFLNADAYKESMNDFVKNGDVIISDTAEDETVGKACEVQNVGDRKILAGLHTMLLRPYNGIFAPYFLGYYINSETYHSKLLPLIQGIKVCSIGKQAVQNTTLKIPSIEEQAAIASILVNADKEIEIQKQKLAAMQEQKKGLMQVLLTGKKRIK